MNSTASWTLARRTARMEPSVLREILKVTERPGIVSLAGGLPSPAAFPLEALREATARVLREQPHEALQYAASEGHGPLREWVAERMRGRGLAADASRILITAGSQQGLDLVGKVLLDAGSRVAVESPTYLGALQAFTPYEPAFVEVDSDEAGPVPALLGAAEGARGFYVVPNFQNPTGRAIPASRRALLMERCAALGLPVIEDDPYGELWYDEPPPAALASYAPEGTVYLGSFSKVLAPGLRLGFIVAPRALHPALLQAKQASDLHTNGFSQRVAYEVVRTGLLETHLPEVRARYRVQRDAMHAALTRHLPPGCSWQVPRGGMFFWVTLPESIDATALLPGAVERGVAFVPGAPFHARRAGANTMRLSFVTAAPQQIEHAVATLGQVVREALA